MSNDYVTKMLIDQRLADLRHEADEERLAHLVRGGQPRPRRWWERLMLFRSRHDVRGHRQHRSVSLGSARS
ncbi:MAG: hypothetical protein QM650_12190 [Microlunatus sp.]